MSADYEKEALYALRRNAKDPSAWTKWGIGLLKEGFTVPHERRHSFFAEAARKFAVAADLAPHEPQYWYNLAAATHCEAECVDALEQHSLYTAASEYYEKAVHLKARWHAAWSAWGSVLSALAQRTKDKDSALRLLQQAEVRYTVANELDPDSTWTLLSWGAVIIGQAEAATKSEAPLLWRNSQEKFAAIVVKDPKHAHAWAFWGVCLYQEALLLEDKVQSAALFDSAIRKYEVATQLAPHDAGYWQRWGETLVQKASQSESQAKRALLTDAANRFEKGARLDPDNASAWAVWGQALYLEAESTPLQDRVSFYQEAGLRYSIAVDLAPNEAGLWGNWALAVSGHALCSPSTQAAKLLDRSLVLINRSLDLDAEGTYQHSNKGFTLLLRSRFATGEEKAAYLMEALLHCDRATELEPDLHFGWSNRAAVLLEQAAQVPDTNREELLAAAHETLDKAEEIKPHTSQYCRAVSAALQNDYDSCRAFLQNAAENDTLPHLGYIRGDAAFDSVRNEEWFRQLIDSLSR